MVSVSGLGYFSNYISAQEEAHLLKAIDSSPWLMSMKRRVQHYGYGYDYKRRTIAPDMYVGALPKWAVNLAKQLHADGLAVQMPDQVIVNEYVPGQGISPHVDCEPCFSDTILSLSLGSPCVMDFTHRKTAYTMPLLLEQRSLLVMRGDARFDWKHGIASRKTDFYYDQAIVRGRRVSLTFRKVLLAA